MKLRLPLLCAALLAPLPWPSDAQARPGPPSQSPEDRAVALFGAGQKLYDQGDYANALDKFREVDALMKGSPNARLYMARCWRELGRLPEAFELMTETVAASNEKAKSDPSYLRTRDAAAAEREAVVPKIGRLVIAASDAPEGLEIKVGRRVLEPRHLGRELAFEPGDLVVVAEAPGHERFRRAIALRAGSLQTVAVVLRREGEGAPPGPSLPGGDSGKAEPSTGVRDAGFVVLAVGVLGMGTFAVSGSMANARYSKIEEECGGVQCLDPQYTDQIHGGKTMDLVANIGLGVGLAGLVAGSLMVGLGWPEDAASSEATDGAEPGPQAEPGPEQSVSFDLGPTGSMLGYRVRF
jgi:tetratricopeptide (TPR) repeat protein